MTPVAKRLLANVVELQQKVKNVELQRCRSPTVQASCSARSRPRRSPAREERYSHIDLVDFEANVEGSQAALEAVEPLIAKKDPNLAKEIEALAQQIDALAELLSEVPAQIVRG